MMGPASPKISVNEALKPFARLEEARNQNKVSGSRSGPGSDYRRRCRPCAWRASYVLGKSQDLGGLQADIVL